ncbi:MAG: hypothetical protein AAF415_08055 [Pseudomonadota bacterium]
MGFNLEMPDEAEIASMPSGLSGAWQGYLAGEPEPDLTACDGAMALLLRACLARDRGAHSEAVAHGLAALEVSPDHMMLRRNMAALLATTGRRDLAEDLLTATVDEAPLDPETWLSRADFLARHDDLEAALADLRRALLADPNYPPALRGQARILRRLGRRREARLVEQKLQHLTGQTPQERTIAKTG